MFALTIALVSTLIAVVVPAEPAAASTARLSVTVPTANLLVLPARDGFHDGVTVRVAAERSWTVDVVAIRGTRTVTVKKKMVLRAAGKGISAGSVRVGVRILTAGSWKIQARRSSHPATRATATRLVRVGSGEARTVKVVPSARRFFPYRDHYREVTSVTVTARDETGTPLPFTGTARATSHGRTRSVAVRSPTGHATASLSVAGLPTGTGILTASARGPAGTTHTSARVRLTLSPTGIASVKLRSSLAELQPVVDGRADTVRLSVGSTTSTGRSMFASGTLAVVGSTGTVRRWPLRTSNTTTVTWDGRVGGAIAVGTYTVRATLKGPQGVTRTATARLAITTTHLPYRVRTLYDLPVATGNQQGLAESGGTVYVTADLGGGSTRVDLLNRDTGTLIRSLGPLPLGHGAEVTVGSDGLLYVVNGGGTTTTNVFVVDPTGAGAVTRTFDLHALGTNGLVAFDTAHNRLLVYTGTPGAYRVTPVELDGTPGTSVPLQDEGIPQGLELVNGELWLYTTVESGSRISKFDPVTGALLGTIDLALKGEAEGLAYDPSNGEVLLGAHTPSRVGILEAVRDE